MSALSTFDRELAQRNGDISNSWYDDGIVFVGQLAADLSEADLIALSDIWPTRPLMWQKHCAEVLSQARSARAVALLLEIVDRAVPDVALAALETLRDFSPALFTNDQRRRVLSAISATQALPIGKLHQLVLGAFLARLRADEDGTK